MKRKHSLFLLLPAVAMVASSCDLLNKITGKDKDGDNTQQTGGNDNTGGDDTGGGTGDDGGGSGQQTVAVTGVALNETSKTLEVDESFTLIATVSPENATNKSVTWSSSNSNIVSVVDGVVTAKAAGDAVITVTTGDGSKTATCSVTVTAKQEQTNYGTVDAPITVSQASAIIAAECVNDGDVTKSVLVVQGEVKAIRRTYQYSEGPSFEFDMTDGSKDIYVYRCLATEAQKEDFGVGALVKVSAKAKNFKGTLEMCDNGDDKSTLLSVTPCDKHASEIVAVHAPETISQGASLINDSVDLDITWQEGGTGVVHPTSIDLDTTVAGEVTGTVHYGDLTKTFTITVTPSKENKFVEAYQAAVALSSGSTSEFYFEGVVVGKRDKDCFVQYGEYGIDVYNPSITVNVGDKIGVSATLKKYNGMPETDSIKSVEALGTATLPEAAVVTSKEGLVALNINILCEVEAEIKTLPSFTSGKDYTITLSLGSDDIPLFIKGAVTSRYAEVIGSLKVGDTIKVKDAVRGIYNTNHQVCLTGQSTIEKVVHSVTGVTLNETELSLEAGSAPVTLVATVAPENASNKAVSWESSAPAVASVENGVVTPLAEGNATITVTTEDGGKTATCVVTVTAATRTMTDISVEGPTKTEYEVGQTLDLDGLVVKAVYDSGDPEVITAGYETSIANGTTLALTDTSLVVSYGGFEKTITLTINEKQAIVANGTYVIKHTRDSATYYMSADIGSKNQPLVTTDATKAVAFDFILKDGTKDTYTIKMHGESNYLAIGANDNNGVRYQSAAFEWKITEGSQANGSFDLSGVYAGKTRYLTMYDKTDFRCYDSATASNRKENTDLESVVVKDVDSITIKQNPTKMTYYVGEAFDPTGMIVTVNYTDSTSEDISEGFTFEGSTGFQAVNEDRTVKITYQSKNAYVQHVAVVEDNRTIDSIKIDEESVLTKTTYKEGDSWDATGVKVIGVRSDSTEVELTSGVTFTFDSDKAAVGVTSLVVTATYNNGTSDLTASKTFTVSVTAVTADTPTEIVLSTEGGTSASAAKVVYKGVTYEKAIKCGTGSVAGAMKIKVPTGATKLVFFAAAWKGENVSLKITGAGEEKTISLTKDDGVTSNSPFTLVGTDDANFKKEIVFDAALAQETELTLTATGGKRFVVWNAGYLK